MLIITHNENYHAYGNSCFLNTVTRFDRICSCKTFHTTMQPP